VRFTWNPQAGTAYLLDEDIVNLGYSYVQFTQDMYDDITSGNFPKFDLLVQKLPFNITPDELGFDPLDPTKEWPLEIVGGEKVGEMELNQWPGNQFQENELVAFAPSRMIPGILPSDDKVLQARMFIYGDAQRHRLGINHQLLPVNKPRCPFGYGTAMNGPENDGEMNFLSYSSAINYFPSHFNNITENPRVAPSMPYTIEGVKQRQPIPNVGTDYSQITTRYLTLDPDRQARFAARWAAMLTGVNFDSPQGQNLVNIWLARLGMISPQLLQNVQALIAMSGKKDNEFEAFRRAFYIASGTR